MNDYIEREAFLADKKWLYCTDCDKRKGKKRGKMVTLYEIGEAPCKSCGIHDMLEEVEMYPAADVPSALWTDEPISGTEFMTHNQGQSGFEIHFRTDDKAKYEAVQDECRRQIGHAKPAADFRPVVRGRWKDAIQSCHDSPHVKCSVCGEYYWRYFKKFNFCPNCGARMEES